MQLLVLAEQLHVSTTTFKSLLEFDLILHNKSLVLVVDLGREFGRDGVVSSGVLENKTLVTLDTREDGGLFNRPLANVGPVFIALGVFLLCVGDLPSRIPVVGELFEKGCLEGSRLRQLA
jgi:hypothetical protein